jgi:16S rRNA (cytidine1402-2'-O)-methyltransferase
VPGRLIVCPTPIGNLGDMTPRARQALADADIVACEDTRRTGLLFVRLDITRPRLVSYHEGNESERSVQLAQAIERGARVAMISDSGTPVISDPGYRLIRTCIDRDLDVEVLAGPSAVITALVASGLPADRWRFEGFLPRRAGELERVLHSSETVVAFESPRRLPDSHQPQTAPRAPPTPPSPSTRSAAWCSPEPAPGPPPASSPRLPAPARTTSTAG